MRKSHLTSGIMMAIVSGLFLFAPSISSAGTAADAVKSLESKMGSSDIKASSQSSKSGAGKSEADKEKAKKELKDLLNKRSKKLGN